MADDLNASELHSFKKLMEDRADEIPEGWCSQAFEELQAQGHLHPGSGMTFGGDAHARLSADGRLYLRSESD